MNRKSMRKRGFTLIEMMIVVAIIAILAGMAIPQYTKYLKKTETAEATRFAKSIIDAASARYTENGGTFFKDDTLSFNSGLAAGKKQYIVVKAVGLENRATCFGDGTDNSGAVYFVYPSASPDVFTDNKEDFWDKNAYIHNYINNCSDNVASPEGISAKITGASFDSNLWLDPTTKVASGTTGKWMDILKVDIPEDGMFKYNIAIINADAEPTVN